MEGINDPPPLHVVKAYAERHKRRKIEITKSSALKKKVNHNHHHNNNHHINIKKNEYSQRTRTELRNNEKGNRSKICTKLNHANGLPSLSNIESQLANILSDVDIVNRSLSEIDQQFKDIQFPLESENKSNTITSNSIPKETEEFEIEIDSNLRFSENAYKLNLEDEMDKIYCDDSSDQGSSDDIEIIRSKLSLEEEMEKTYCVLEDIIEGRRTTKRVELWNIGGKERRELIWSWMPYFLLPNSKIQFRFSEEEFDSISKMLLNKFNHLKDSFVLHVLLPEAVVQIISKRHGIREERVWEYWLPLHCD